MRVSISHSILPLVTEKRYDDNVTVGELKDKLHLVCGTSPEYMELHLQSKEGVRIAVLTDDSRTVASYGAGEFAYVHVVDTDPSSTVASITDAQLATVEKYELSDEQYENHNGLTFRKWAQNNIKREVRDPAEVERERAEIEAVEAKERDAAAAISVGMRAQLVGVPGEPRGEIAFVGEVAFQAGMWIGVKLDEPVGKNDGSVKGKRYFTTRDKYGIFCRPSKVSVGDYPERDEFEDSDLDEEL